MKFILAMMGISMLMPINKKSTGGAAPTGQAGQAIGLLLALTKAS